MRIKDLLYSLIFIKDIAIEGKKRCKVKDYFNGIKKEDLK